MILHPQHTDDDSPYRGSRHNACPHRNMSEYQWDLRYHDSPRAADERQGHHIPHLLKKEHRATEMAG